MIMEMESRTGRPSHIPGQCELCEGKGMQTRPDVNNDGPVHLYRFRAAPSLSPAIAMSAGHGSPVFCTSGSKAWGTLHYCGNRKVIIIPPSCYLLT